ncbi:MAG: hypothetical protein IJI14_11120 [Anaerolineaceae bacterium]|nr:hypothetical protein [Anaerolineaceae bacterium]
MTENTNIEEKETTRWLTPEEVSALKKSDYYREDLGRHIGQRIVMDVPYYQFGPCNEKKDMACFRSAQVIKIGKDKLDDSSKIDIEHLWVYVNKGTDVDPRKPLRVIGFVYEYPHKCGNNMIRNVGVRVAQILQY